MSSNSGSRSIPPILVNSDIIHNNEEKADAFNTFFTNQTLLEEPNTEPSPPTYDISSFLSMVQFNHTDIEPLLRSLPLGKAVGPDTINNRILKELSVVLAHPLCDLFNYSLSISTFPTSWKIANVCPIHKKGESNLVGNYRPISLLNSLSKVFERAVYKHIYNHILSNNILTDFQSGFRPRDSTVNQLASIYNAFCEALDNGKEVRVVFCDISKAFDRVWHAGLLSKLHAIGVRENMLLWLGSYLQNRQQRVTLQGSTSSLRPIKAGVPQGSILGPLLFIVYINDIVRDIDASISLFADDTSLSMVVDIPNDAASVSLI